MGGEEEEGEGEEGEGGEKKKDWKMEMADKIMAKLEENNGEQSGEDADAAAAKKTGDE